MQIGNVIHEIVIVAWAEVSRRLVAAADRRKPVNGDDGKSLQLRGCHAGVKAVRGDGRLEVAGVRMSKIAIPTDAKIVHPVGVRGPGPTVGRELGFQTADGVKNLLRVTRAAVLANRVTGPPEVGSRERVVVAGMPVDFDIHII